MSNKDTEDEEFAIKRISTPQGDVPTVESVMGALNLIVDRIHTLTNDLNERLKYSGAGIEASEYVERNLSETTIRINDLKKQLETNTEQIDEINNNVTQLDSVVINLEKMLKTVLTPDFEPQSKSYEEILEIKNMTKSLKDAMYQLQKSFGGLEADIKKMYWEYKENIREDLKDLIAYEPEKTHLLNYFRILNLPKPVLEIDTKVLVFGPRGTGKTSLIRAIAKDQNIRIIELNLPLIISLSPSKQVESISNLFQFLRFQEDLKPCVVLVDNFEIIQKLQGPSFLPFIEILMLELSKTHLTRDKILIIFILNDIGEMENRLLDQFNEKIELKLPDQLARALILRKFLGENNLEPDLELEEMSSKLAEASFTEGFSALNLKEIFNIVKLQTFTEGRTSINENDLISAIQLLKSRRSMQKIGGGKAGASTETNLREKVQYLEEELNNLKLLLTNSTRMLKHALRLALSDNYNLVLRLFNHYELTRKSLTIEELIQVTGLKEESITKIINKMPYRLLFPKVGDGYFIAFDKSTFDEILAEFTLTV